MSCLPSWFHPIYLESMVGQQKLAQPLPPKATNSCYYIEWEYDVITSVTNPPRLPYEPSSKYESLPSS